MSEQDLCFPLQDTFHIIMHKLQRHNVSTTIETNEEGGGWKVIMSFVLLTRNLINRFVILKIAVNFVLPHVNTQIAINTPPMTQVHEYNMH